MLENYISFNGTVFGSHYTLWDKNRVNAVKELLTQVQNENDLRRIQAVYFRLAYDFEAEQIADMVGYHVGSVRRLHSRYMKEGISCFKHKGTGGRRNQNMSFKVEESLIKGFIKKAEQGRMLEVSQVKAAYEAKLGYEVHPSVIYTVLHRHGWRKIAPRPRHPEQDAQAGETFKKTSGS